MNNKFNDNNMYKKAKLPSYINIISQPSYYSLEDAIECFQDLDEKALLMLSEQEGEETFTVGLTGNFIKTDLLEGIDEVPILEITSVEDAKITWNDLLKIIRDNDIGRFDIILESDDEAEYIFVFSFGTQEISITKFDKKEYLFSSSTLNF